MKSKFQTMKYKNQTTKHNMECGLTIFRRAFMRFSDRGCGDWLLTPK